VTTVRLAADRSSLRRYTGLTAVSRTWEPLGGDLEASGTRCRRPCLSASHAESVR